MNKIFISIVLLPILVLPLQAAGIRGFVLDGASGEPLPMATVVVEGTDIGATTNLDGYFVITGLASGNLKLSVSYLGYQTKQIEVTAAEQSNPLRIELVRRDVVLKEAAVSHKREEALDRRASPRVSTVPVDGKLIKTMPSLGGEMDVLRALQYIPGVKASSDISSALHVRGGSPEQTLILMDHNVVYNPAHMFGIFSTFNADAVKHIELMKGGFPAEYGGRSGSVLEVVTNEGNRRDTHGLVSIGIISAKGALEGPLPKGLGSYAISGRRTYFDPMLAVMREALDTDLPDYYFYDANTKLNLDGDAVLSLNLTDRTTLTFAGYLGDDKLNFNFGPSDDRLIFGLNWGNKTFSARLRHALNKDLYFTASVAHSNYTSKWKAADEETLLDQGEDQMNDLSFKGDLEYHGLEGHRIKTGFWISRYDILFNERNADIEYVNIDEFTSNFSAYIQDSWRINSFFELQPGLRAYYHEAGKQTALDARFASVFHYDPRLRFKIAAGRYTQWMNLITFGEGFSNFDLWIPVDRTMIPSYSDQIIVGSEWDREDGLELTTEAYYTKMNDLTTFDPLTDRSVTGEDAFVQGHGHAYGWEVMLQKKQGRLTGWLGYSLSWTKRRYPNSLINGGDWFYPKWDRRHDFIAVASYPLSGKWDFSGSWRYNTGQGFTNFLGVYTFRYAGINPDDFANDSRTVLPGAKNNYRFPSDHRLDLTVTYNHTFFKLPAKLNISIFNAYSRRPYWQRWADTFKLEVTDIKLLPILPLLSYEVKF